MPRWRLFIRRLGLPLDIISFNPKDYGTLSEVKKQYNYVLSSTRVIVERAFGLMKSKFQRLKDVELNDVEKINKFLHAVTALHNFCIIEGEVDVPDFELDEELGLGKENDVVLKCMGSKKKDV